MMLRLLVLLLACLEEMSICICAYRSSYLLALCGYLHFTASNAEFICLSNR